MGRTVEQDVAPVTCRTQPPGNNLIRATETECDVFGGQARAEPRLRGPLGRVAPVGSLMGHLPVPGDVAGMPLRGLHEPGIGSKRSETLIPACGVHVLARLRHQLGRIARDDAGSLCLGGSGMERKEDDRGKSLHGRASGQVGRKSEIEVTIL